MAINCFHGYELFSQPNQCCAHVGLIIYVHQQFAATVLTDIKAQSSGWEYLCVQLSHQKLRTINTSSAIFTEHPLNLWMVLTLSLMSYLPF